MGTARQRQPLGGDPAGASPYRARSPRRSAEPCKTCQTALARPIVVSVGFASGIPETCADKEAIRPMIHLILSINVTVRHWRPCAARSMSLSVGSKSRCRFCLGMYDAAPHLRALIANSSLKCWGTKITGRKGDVCLIRRIKSSPSVSGIAMSVMTMSQRPSAITPNASSPLVAVSTW
jgi:hypothetical protein